MHSEDLHPGFGALNTDAFPTLRYHAWKRYATTRLAARAQFDRLQESLVERGHEMMTRQRDNLPASDADLDRAIGVHNYALAMTETLAQLVLLSEHLDPLDRAYSNIHRLNVKAMQAYDNAEWLVAKVRAEVKANVEAVRQDAESKLYHLQELLHELAFDRQLRQESNTPTTTADYDAITNVVEEMQLLDDTLFSLRYKEGSDWDDVADVEAEACKMIDNAYWLSDRIEEEMNEVTFSSLIELHWSLVDDAIVE